MSNGADGQLFSNISATTAAFRLQGGRYVMTVIATFGGGNVQLQMLGPDASTYVAPFNIAGSANNLTANGSQTLDLPPGQYKFVVATATAVYANLAAIPGNSL